MAITPDQRNYYYLLEAERTGIHKPILAALYAAQGKPQLADDETGLGMSSANQINAAQLDTFPEQVQYAANTIRSFTDNLIKQGWQATEVWNAAGGRYADEFLKQLAAGYAPSPNDSGAARLETSDAEAIQTAYLEDLAIDFEDSGLPENLASLDQALLSLVERVPNYYTGLANQRDALLEGVRIWRRLNTRTEAIASLVPNVTAEDDPRLDAAMKQFVQRISPNYSGYPYQRESLLRLTQLWRQLDSREDAIASLRQNTSPETNLKIVDPALIAFVQRIPSNYQAKGTQRNALTEAYRLWRKLDSRVTALKLLGLAPEVLAATPTSSADVTNAAKQLDRELLAFVGRIANEFRENFDYQREALIRLVQLWRGLTTRDEAIRSLFEDIKKLNLVRPTPPKPQPKPVVVTPPPRPARWTTRNIQLFASIIPDGTFTWAEATHGGTRMPPNQATVDAMIRIARLAQSARDRIDRPFIITSWYRPPAINRRVGGVSNSRHIVGDAIDFYCDGLSGDQLYWQLDPWWPGGLGRYARFPLLSHIDARSFRARWKN